MAKGAKLKLRNGLTPKQNAFKNEVIKQIKNTGEANLTEAAMKVYDVNNRNTAKAVGSEVLANPNVRRSLEDALSDAGVSLDSVVTQIREIAGAKPDSISGDVKLKSNIELLKLMGAYPDNKNPKRTTTNKVTIVNMSFTEAKEKFKQISDETEVFIKEAEVD